MLICRLPWRRGKRKQGGKQKWTQKKGSGGRAGNQKDRSVVTDGTKQSVAEKIRSSVKKDKSEKEPVPLEVRNLPMYVLFVFIFCQTKLCI